MKTNPQPEALNRLEALIFASRWFQAPMYLGLLVAQLVFVYKFGVELLHLISHANTLQETEIMLVLLGLVDAAMVANLIFMVVVGGYETFVSRLYLDDHPDRPDWLSHVDAGVLKIKLAASLITISSVHLLKTFINAENMELKTVIAQVAIHLVFLLSLLALSTSERIMKGIHR